MKKLIIIAALALGFCVAASAQPRAVGIRGGFGVEVSYQHTLGANFVDLGVGLSGDYVNAAATYNWMLAKPQWTSRGERGFYAGPGAALGFGSGFFNVGVAGEVGLEYQFWFPLQLSIDVRPQLGIMTGNGISKFTCWGWYPSLGIRYKF